MPSTPCWYVCRYEHPYLLADNRHYPFYIWKNIFRYHHMVKYLLVPGYGVAILLMLYALCESTLHPQTPHPYQVPKLECIHGILAPFVEPQHMYLVHGTTNYQRVNTQMQRHSPLLHMNTYM